MDETPEAIWRDWYEPFFDFVHANTDFIRAVAYINADWNEQPMWKPGGSNGYRGDSRVQANAYLKERWLNEIDTAFWLHGSDQLFASLLFEGRQVGASSVFEFL